MTRQTRDVLEVAVMTAVWAIAVACILLSREAHASDWFCTERAVVREADVYKSCGVAQSRSEATARSEALSDSKREFVNVCDTSSDCLGHEVTVQTGRTECLKGLFGWTCRRLLYFHVLDTKSKFQFHPNYEAYVRSRHG